MAKIGRPRALDEIKRREVCALISVGCGMMDAGRYVGCSASTIRREALRNEKFHESLRQAELAAQLGPLNAIRKAAATNWRAAAWLLERTNPEQFAKQDAKMLKLEEVNEVVNQLVETIAQEIDDPATRGRVYRRLLAEAHSSMRETFAAERPRRDPKRARKMLENSDNATPTNTKTHPPGA